MLRRIWITAGIIAVALMFSAGAILSARPVAAQQTPPTTPNRYITVVGHGEIQARPDTAIVQIGVETEAKTAKEALANNTQQAAAVQKKISSLGIDAKDIQTNGFSVFPVYNTDGRQITGYRVSNSVSVKIRGIDKVGTLLDQVIQAGANTVSGVNFTVDNPRALQDQARVAAMADAKARADVLAKAGGATVGDVQIITENVGSPIPAIMPMAARADGAANEVPIQAGELNIAIDVQVTYTLK